MFKNKNERLKIFKKLYPFIKPYKFQYFLLYGFKFFFLLISLVTPFFYMLLVNDVMISRKMHMLLVVVLGYAFLFLLQTLGVVLNKIVYNKLFIKFNLKIKTSILSNYTQISMQDYTKYKSGDLKNRIDEDSNIFEKFFISHCLNYIYAIISTVVVLIILLNMNWLLALFSFIMVPFSFLFTKVIGKKAQKVSNEYRENYGIYEGFLHESLQSWREIKSNNLEKEKINKLVIHWDKLSKLFIKNQIYLYINRTFISFKDFFITKMNIYFLGGLLIINGQMEVSVLLVFMSYYEQLFTNISTITDSMLTLKTDIPSINRIFEVIDYPILKKEHVKIKGNEVIISHAYFKYYEFQEMILKDINLDIHDKEHIAIVGRSGCGKTTFTKLILGMYKPYNGKISIGGYNIQSISAYSVNRKINVVMQEPMLFNLTIHENLLLAKKTATYCELDEACAKADILRFIQNLPEKYETVIGERGIKLSGGQKQRLAIARTILFDPDIIIFDEATSSLDHESEKAILNSIRHLSKEKTIITIAHRLSTIMSADRVIVLDQGKIIACGRHDELKNNNQIYDLLFDKQYQDV